MFSERPTEIQGLICEEFYPKLSGVLASQDNRENIYLLKETIIELLMGTLRSSKFSFIKKQKTFAVHG